MSTISAGFSSNTLRDLYGDRVADRIARLAQSTDGWDGKDAKAMRWDSLEAFVALSKTFKPDPAQLAIYLDYQGCLVVSWPGKKGSTVDVSFAGEHVEICSDTLEVDISSDDPDLARLLAEL